MLCCSTLLVDFEPVTIKIAKDQNLSLIPMTISGRCGRLMCCLKYENDQDEEDKRDMPDIGESITTPYGQGEVVGLNILDKLIQIENNDNKRVIEYTVDELIEEGIITAQSTK